MIETLPEPQPLPVWLLDIFPKRGDRSVNHNHQASEFPRNHTLTSLAGTMRRPGMSLEAIEAALLAENARYDPPLPEDEVRKIVRSVGRYQPHEGPELEWEPRQDLPPERPPVPTMPPGMVVGPLTCKRRSNNVPQRR